MRLFFLSLLCGSVLFSARISALDSVLQVVKSSSETASLLKNGDFESRAGAQFAAWTPYQGGYQPGPDEGRAGSQALRCEALAAGQQSGASQTLFLDRTSTAPILVSGWSRAEAVSGSADAGYSLYVDLAYADGSTLWGQTADFRCGSHDWERREVVILPEKPVKTCTIYALLRGHTGRAWFDDFRVQEIKAEGNAVLFQGVPMALTVPFNSGSSNSAAISGARPAIGQPNSRKSMQRTVATRDGLKLSFEDTTVSSLVVGETELVARGPQSDPTARGGFLVRDVAANSDVYPFSDGQCAQLGVTLETRLTASSEAIIVSGRITDTTRKDRALTLLFALPVDATGWSWDDDVRRSRLIGGRDEYANTVGVRCGSTGTLSLYPLAAISNDKLGLALALDMAQPAQYRLVYHAGTRQFFIAYDFGLVKETQPSPGSADFRFVLYQFEPRWGFRAALAKLYRLFPDYFLVRSKKQGIWMPFTDVGRVKGWEDFGFRYHEGNNNVVFDDAHDILSFRYTEPMTWWMPMRTNDARTPAVALRVRDELAQATRPNQRQMAQVSQPAAMFDASDAPSLLFRDEPWCQGAVWSLNPNPHLPGPVNAATVHWNEALKQRLYGPDAKGNLDGEYLDSLEGYVTAELNFRREHFQYSTVPLTFDRGSKQPALFKGLAVFEFTQWFCQQVHALGKLTFANGVPYRFTFLAPWLDIMGTETDWLRAGKFAPVSDAQMNVWRSMSGQKPYLLLLNTDYNAFTSELVEKYFQRSLFYGMFPSMFSHNAADNPYWQNPKWYERDRSLFKKYLPLVKRVAEAGWQPVTGVRTDNPRVFVERFGPDEGRVVFITLWNETASPQKATLTLCAPEFVQDQPRNLRELIANQPLTETGGSVSVSLPAQSAALIAVEPR